MKRNGFSTHKFVTLSLLVAIMFLFQFTNLGFIRLGTISITFMCIPIIIGTLTLGLIPGLLLGAVFASLSFYNALVAPDAIFAAVLSQSGYLPLIPVIFIPRLLIPIFTYLAQKACIKLNEKLAVTICALVGSLTNTVFFLSFLWVFFGQHMAVLYNVSSPLMLFGPICLIVLTNGVPEALAAVIICIPVMHALKKAMPKMFSGSR
ncbi:MAG: ECF transporter S component [Clostridiales bacterium]|nr:ECF transporter S component [Clostridiales bacterium]MBQ2816800.1 ECF transporter S component [Clostridia bacterium]MBQ4638522.1 ECF transporter S component [Clostridia bacterium]